MGMNPDVLYFKVRRNFARFVWFATPLMWVLEYSSQPLLGTFLWGISRKEYENIYPEEKLPFESLEWQKFGVLLLTVPYDIVGSNRLLGQSEKSSQGEERGRTKMLH